jgi:hypothetical protein
MIKLDLTKEDLEVLNVMEYSEEIVKDEYYNELWLFVLCKSQDLEEDWKLAIKSGDETQERYNQLSVKIGNLLSKLPPNSEVYA